MSFLLAKSDKNLDAAKLLNEKTYFASSVHCSYYSCVQMIKYILISKLGETDQTLHQLGEKTEKGSHEVLINLCVKHLQAMKKDVRTFNNGISQLKKVRNESDYLDVEILPDNSREVYRMAKEIRTQLKTSFAI